MAVKIRLSRFGKKGKPSYRFVAMDSKEKRDGNKLEILGTYDPMTAKPYIKIDRKRLEFWLTRGAKPTPIVAKILHL